jgi:hypothetical protein
MEKKPATQRSLPAEACTCAKAPSRRTVLAYGHGAALAGVPLAALAWPRDASAAAGVQADWRFCNKCHQLFFDGYPQKGRCAAGGGHQAQGYNFKIDHDDAKRIAGGPRQYDWRCTQCYTMFFDGYPDKKKCPAGGGHVAQGYMFGLLHSGAGQGQDAWRFCVKCHALFFDGYPNKGRCTGGEGHAAAGLNFKLPFGEAVPSVGTARRIVQDTVVALFNENRGRMADAMRRELTRADRLAKGYTLSELVLQIGTRGAEFAFTSDTAFNFRVKRTHLYFKSTQPSDAGSYADPRLEVNFDALLQGVLVLPRRAGEKPRVDALALSIPWLEVIGRNAAGNAALGFFKSLWMQVSSVGQDIVQRAADKYLRVDLTPRVNKALEKL